MFVRASYVHFSLTLTPNVENARFSNEHNKIGFESDWSHRFPFFLPIFVTSLSFVMSPDVEIVEDGTPPSPPFSFIPLVDKSGKSSSRRVGAALHG